MIQFVQSLSKSKVKKPLATSRTQEARDVHSFGHQELGFHGNASSNSSC